MDGMIQLLLQRGASLWQLNKYMFVEYISKYCGYKLYFLLDWKWLLVQCACANSFFCLW